MYYDEYLQYYSKDKNVKIYQVVVVHAFNPSIGKWSSVSLRPCWSTEQVPKWISKLDRETLSWEKTKQNQTKWQNTTVSSLVVF